MGHLQKDFILLLLKTMPKRYQVMRQKGSVSIRKLVGNTAEDMCHHVNQPAFLKEHLDKVARLSLGPSKYKTCKPDASLIVLRAVGVAVAPFAQ